VLIGEIYMLKCCPSSNEVRIWRHNIEKLQKLNADESGAIRQHDEVSAHPHCPTFLHQPLEGLLGDVSSPYRVGDFRKINRWNRNAGPSLVNGTTMEATQHDIFNSHAVQSTEVKG
jgi:hypothetical protein